MANLQSSIFNLQFAQRAYDWMQRYEEKHNAASFFAENMQDTCIFFSLS